MLDDAYFALDAIYRDATASLDGIDEWVHAFTTVKWVAKTQSGVVLTLSGREAYNEMSRDRKVRGSAFSISGSAAAAS